MALIEIPNSDNLVIVSNSQTVNQVASNETTSTSTIITGTVEISGLTPNETPDAKEALSFFPSSTQYLQGFTFSGEPIFSNVSSPEQLALQNLEKKAMQNLPAQNLTELRAGLFVEILEIANKPVGQRTAEEKLALEWLAKKVKQNRIEATKYALNEYEKWQSNPWTYQPPDGFDRYNVGAPANALQWTWTTPNPPPIRSYGTVAAYSKLTYTGGQTALAETLRSITRLQEGSVDYKNLVNEASVSGVSTSDLVKITGTSLAVASAIGAGLATSTLMGTAAFTTVFPFTVAAANATAAAAGTATVLPVGSFALSTAGPAAVILLSVMYGVLEGINVFEKERLQGDLEQESKDAYNSALPDIAELLKDEAGAAEVYATFVESTLSPNTGDIGVYFYDKTPSVYSGTAKHDGSAPDILQGGNGNDTLDGADDNDTLYGNSGNDKLYGWTGNDILNGGDGNDIVYGESGTDTLYGGNGNDALIGGEDNDVLYGELGNDFLSGKAGNDILNGGDGDDNLLGEDGKDTLNGNAGNDTLNGGAENDVLNGSTGYDTAFYSQNVTDYAVSFTSNGNVQVIDTVTSNGNEGTDILSGVEQINFAGNGVTRIVTGTAANDNLTNDKYWSMMFGGDGNDTITAAYGNDTLVGGNGNDVLNGGAGYDTAVYTGQYKDYAVSFTSNGNVQVKDTVTSNGNEGTDILSGVEQINFAGNGVTLIFKGTANNDYLVNTKQHWSMMYGDNGNDSLFGNSGNDTLLGGNDNDVLFGNSGNDNLIGGNGNDALLGDSGNDALTGGSGNDTLLGGAGLDVFVFNSVSEGIDLIRDFQSSDDKILIYGSSFGATSANQFSFDYSNGALSFGGQQFATLENVKAFVPLFNVIVF
ncbi:hypothetical protein A6S26_16875 [Nostoc sp. ATCC 43529]|nr:hypothetical protein A6S26_16875 [Nostoc sp. ATCC 43529]